MLEREMASFVQGKLLIAGHLGGRVCVGGGHVRCPHPLGVGRENRDEKKHPKKERDEGHSIHADKHTHGPKKIKGLFVTKLCQPQ
jgi:hypothetical protein